MEKMKKQQLTTIIIAALILVVGVISTLYIYNQKENEISMLMTEKANLNQVINQKDSVLNDVEGTFAQIEDNLKFIREKRHEISLDQKEGGKNRKLAVIEDIKLMNTMIEASNQKIEELQARLKKAGLNSKALEQRIAALTESIESQNVEIAELKKVIDEKDMHLAELNTKVEDINKVVALKTDTINYKEKQIVDRTNELNTAHVALGTYKELKEEGILAKEGGVLGLGASKSIQENFVDNSHFTTLDIRTTKTIPLHAKKAKVISEHPVSSYSLVEENGQIAYLQIDNPEEFWKISKYAVIEVK
jgi:DNA repair exonuclease SbcCD ATPase subunit